MSLDLIEEGKQTWVMYVGLQIMIIFVTNCLEIRTLEILKNQMSEKQFKALQFMRKKDGSAQTTQSFWRNNY